MHAADAEGAHARAITIGREEEWLQRVEGKEVHCSFVGLMDLLDLSGLDDSEVWSEFSELQSLASAVPPKEQLRAFDGPPLDPHRLTLFDEGDLQ